MDASRIAAKTIDGFCRGTPGQGKSHLDVLLSSEVVLDDACSVHIADLFDEEEVESEGVSGGGVGVEQKKVTQTVDEERDILLQTVFEEENSVFIDGAAKQSQHQSKQFENRSDQSKHQLKQSQRRSSRDS